ncbi:MAG: dihydroneopterin aldolase [Wolinella sp.]
MTLIIENLRVQAIIGIDTKERQQPQRILIDGRFSYDFNGIHTDYVALKELILAHIAESHFGLIEEALFDLHEVIKKKFDEFKEIELTIRKPDILSDCVVGATLKKSY